MIRIGILGAAKIAPPALIAPARKRDDCAVVCVAARDRERARAYAAEHGIPESLGSYDALIAHPGIDLIYNALPPHLHARLTIAALEAGKAVLCEKPLAVSAKEASNMLKLAEKKNSRSMLSESEKLPHLTEPTNTQARKRTLAVNWL
jgi:predicted dehydrogenase